MREVAKVIVQWCVKGMTLPDDYTAKAVIDGGDGLQCNWWRGVKGITPQEIADKLTEANLDLHVNHFTSPDPATGLPFNKVSPFISLSAGVVERVAAAKTNFVRRARQTALWFGSNYYQENLAYLFECWLLLGPRSAVPVEGVAEEIRDLNTYRRYSAYQPEGEITAKIIVPANQIAACERWDTTDSPHGKKFSSVWRHNNPNFISPEVLSNVRELI
ncbi:hypothetical protein AB0M12_14305 [Nocardia vinacea]|uniref:hypothetical protein n=1 Tax=Nocardia vinacea TaxID=96468 RepID=UPI003418AE47